MKISKVKVFDKKLSNFQSRELCQKLDGKIVRNGCIKCDGKKYDIMDYEVREVDYYEFDRDEEMAYSMFASSTEQARQLYDSCLRKENRYKRLLLDSVDKDAVFDSRSCDVSPFGVCCLKSSDDGVERCVFCGREKERWILK